VQAYRIVPGLSQVCELSKWGPAAPGWRGSRWGEPWPDSGLRWLVFGHVSRTRFSSLGRPELGYSFGTGTEVGKESLHACNGDFIGSVAFSLLEHCNHYLNRVRVGVGVPEIS
jgi:hypothetical protein